MKKPANRNSVSILLFFILLNLFPCTAKLSGQIISRTLDDSSNKIADSIMQVISDFDVDQKINTLLNFSRHYSLRNPDLSLFLIKEANNLAQQTNDPVLKSNTLNGLAIIYFYMGNNPEAIKVILESIGYIREELHRNPDSLLLIHRMVSMYSNAGNIYQAMGELEKSLEMHITSLRLADTLLRSQPDNKSYASTLVNLQNNTAVVYWNLGELDRANDLLQKALSGSRKIEDTGGIIVTLNNIGLIQIDEGFFQDAVYTYREALMLEQQVNDSMGISGNYNNMGLVMEKLGNKRKALSYYLLSLQISTRLGYSIGIANTCANVGSIYSEFNLPDSALHFTKIGIDEARRADSKTYLLKNYETLFHIYEKQKHFDKALEAHKNYISIKDSIFNEEKSKQIAEMEARFESEKKEKENKILRQNISIQQRTSLLLVVSVFALLLIALLLFYFYKLKNKALKQKTQLYEQKQLVQELEKARLEDQLFAEQQINKLQNEKLEHKNRELSSRILNAINKNEAMNNILAVMEKFKIAGNHDIDKCFNSLNHIIKENVSLDKEWDQFKLHFEEVNPGFFYLLREKFPNLTQNELKLCAYYRINLDTKEIAKMLSVTVGAVQKSRHRLRKKMNIPSETELSEFMSNF